MGTKRSAPARVPTVGGGALDLGSGDAQRNAAVVRTSKPKRTDSGTNRTSHPGEKRASQSAQERPPVRLGQHDRDFALRRRALGAPLVVDVPREWSAVEPHRASQSYCRSGRAPPPADAVDKSRGQRRGLQPDRAKPNQPEPKPAHVQLNLFML